MSVGVDLSSRPVSDDPEPSPRRAQLIGRALFPPAQPRPITWRGWVLAAVAVAAGTLLGLNRTRGAGALNTIWAEDGSILLTDALTRTFWDALTTPLNGYHIIVPRLLGEAAALAPVSWAAIILSTEAALVAALIALLVYVASGAHLRSPVLRLIVAAPVVLTPVGALFSPHHLVTLQFLALYALFWVLLWVPASRTGRVVAIGFILLTGLSAILIVTLLPLALVRVYLRRDRYSLALLAAIGVGLAVQFGTLLSGAASRAGISHPRPDPIWALAEYVFWAVPYSVLGQRWLEPQINNQNGLWPTPPINHHYEHAALILIAWCVVGAVVVVAVRRITRPAWVLAVVAAAHSVLILCVEVMAMGYESDTYLVPEERLIITDRYLIPAALLLIVTMVALLRPSTDLDLRLSRWPANVWPLLMYLTLTAVVCVANLRHDNPRRFSQPWDQMVAKAAADCRSFANPQATVAVGSIMWGNGWPQVRIPCDRLR